MTDGDMWIELQGSCYRIGYNFRGTGRFMVLTAKQMKQLEQEIRILKL